MAPEAVVHATVRAFAEIAPNRSNPAGAIDATRAMVGHVPVVLHEGGPTGLPSPPPALASPPPPPVSSASALLASRPPEPVSLDAASPAGPPSPGEAAPSPASCVGDGPPL